MVDQVKAPEIGFTEARFNPVRPDTSTANAIGVLGDVVKEIRVDRAKEDLEEAGDSIRELSLASKNDIRFSSFRKDIVDSKLFTTFKKALAQNKSTEAAALIAAESEVKRLINKNPGFAPEIRQLARDTLGLDPTGSKFKFAIADASASKPTQLEREVEEIKFAGLNLGWTPQQVAVAVRDKLELHMLQEEEEALEIEEKKGERTAKTITDKASLSLDKWLLDFKNKASLTLNSIDGVNVFEEDVKQSLLEAIRTQKLLQRTHFKAALDSADIFLDDESKQSKIASFDKQFDLIEEWISDKDFLATVQKFNELGDAVSGRVFRRVMPVLTGLQSIFGESAVDVFNLLQKTDSPFNKAILELDKTFAPFGDSADKVISNMAILTGALKKAQEDPTSLGELDKKVLKTTYTDLKKKGKLSERAEDLFVNIFQKEKGNNFPLKVLASMDSAPTETDLTLVKNTKAVTSDTVKILFSQARDNGLDLDVDDEGKFIFSRKRGSSERRRAERAEGLVTLRVLDQGNILEFRKGANEIQNTMNPMFKLSDKPGYVTIFPQGKQGYIKEIRDMITNFEREFDALDAIKEEKESKPEAKKEEAPKEPSFTQVPDETIIQLDDGTLALVRGGKLVQPTAQDLQVIG